MADGYAGMIRKRIQNAPEGSVFIGSDFADIADSATIRQTLKRLVESGDLLRIMHGVYEKPRYSPALGENAACSSSAVAEAIARNNHWTIAPDGNTALNLLGLSTQVPYGWSYFSDGPYRTYEIGKVKLSFKHRANREITGLSYKTNLVVHALKALGKNNMDQQTIDRISKNLSKEEKNRCLEEAKECTDWIYHAIKEICLG